MNPKEFNKVFNKAFRVVGGLTRKELKNKPLILTAAILCFGEFTALYYVPKTDFTWSYKKKRKIVRWAVYQKRLFAMQYSRRLFGYWRSFHTPFVYFMYFVAVVHIISSLIFLT